MIHPVPKPAKRPRARRATNSTLPAASSPIARKQILRSSGPKRSAAIGGGKKREDLSGFHPAKPRKPVKAKNAKRRRSEFARAYGSEERVEFVKRQRCVAWLLRDGCEISAGGVDNAHIEGGGAGRKANADKIVPLCRYHHETLHRLGREEFEATYGLDLDDWSERIDARWLALVAAGPR